MVVVARSVPAGAAAEAVTGHAFGASVVREADADAGRALRDGGSAGEGLGGGCTRRCWRATRSMRAMAVFFGVGSVGVAPGCDTPERQRAMLIHAILNRMRHDGGGGRVAKAALLTGIEGASSRPVRRIVVVGD
jgi:hypothetical protein